MNEGLNVLSLFDGMSTGMIALERAGIKEKITTLLRLINMQSK